MRKITPGYYKPFGGAERLFRCQDPEVLWEGPAGTGKTFALLQKVHLLCEFYPGIRVLFVRKTLKSLRESVLVTWEEEVLGAGHKAITGTATRSHRDSYTFPNKSHVVLTGIDTPSRHMSTQWDIICVFEAVECTENDLEYLKTRLRNYAMPFQQIVCDTNPRQPGHWLNQRAKRPVKPSDDPLMPKPAPNAKQMRRIKSRHQDNPFLWDHALKQWTREGAEYMQTLLGLRGPRRAWFLEGAWTQAEGLVLPQWNPEKHLVSWDDVPKLGWYAAAMDFGHRAAGCLQVWGFTGAHDRPIGEQRGYRVAEVYRAGWTIEQWAQAVMDLRQEFPLRTGVADCADPGNIEFLNSYLGYARGRAHGGLFRGADKTKGVASGLELLRSLLADEPAREEEGLHYEGGPRMLFVRDAHPYGRDQELRDRGLPTSFEDEVESYCYPENDGTKALTELPDKACQDHAIDTTRYLWTWAFGKDQTPREDPSAVKAGTWGELWGTPASLMRDKLKAMAGHGRRLGRRGWR